MEKGDIADEQRSETVSVRQTSPGDWVTILRPSESFAGLEGMLGVGVGVGVGGEESETGVTPHSVPVRLP